MKKLFPILLLILALSCQGPRSMEQFVPGSGPYSFTVDMSDSTAVYDFDLFTRIDNERESPSQLRLDICWKDPQDSLFTETVYLPVDGSTSFFSHEAYAPYRSGVVPVVRGIWTVQVSVPEQPEGLRGMGLVTRICQ